MKVEYSSVRILSVVMQLLLKTVAKHNIEGILSVPPLPRRRLNVVCSDAIESQTWEEVKL